MTKKKKHNKRTRAPSPPPPGRSQCREVPEHSVRSRSMGVYSSSLEEPVRPDLSPTTPLRFNNHTGATLDKKTDPLSVFVRFGNSVRSSFKRIKSTEKDTVLDDIPASDDSALLGGDEKRLSKRITLTNVFGGEEVEKNIVDNAPGPSRCTDITAKNQQMSTNIKSEALKQREELLEFQLKANQTQRKWWKTISFRRPKQKEPQTQEPLEFQLKASKFKAIRKRINMSSSIRRGMNRFTGEKNSNSSKNSSNDGIPRKTSSRKFQKKKKLGKCRRNAFLEFVKSSLKVRDKVGYLYKKDGIGYKSQYFFRLSKGGLKFYRGKKEKVSSPVEEICLDFTRCELQAGVSDIETDDPRYFFCIRNDDLSAKSWFLAADSDYERKKWMCSIACHIEKYGKPSVTDVNDQTKKYLKKFIHFRDQDSQQSGSISKDSESDEHYGYRSFAERMPRNAPQIAEQDVEISQYGYIDENEVKNATHITEPRRQSSTTFNVIKDLDVRKPAKLVILEEDDAYMAAADCSKLKSNSSALEGPALPVCMPPPPTTPSPLPRPILPSHIVSLPPRAKTPNSAVVQSDSSDISEPDSATNTPSPVYQGHIIGPLSPVFSDREHQSLRFSSAPEPNDQTNENPVSASAVRISDHDDEEIYDVLYDGMDNSDAASMEGGASSQQVDLDVEEDDNIYLDADDPRVRFLFPSPKSKQTPLGAPPPITSLPPGDDDRNGSHSANSTLSKDIPPPITSLPPELEDVNKARLPSSKTSSLQRSFLPTFAMIGQPAIVGTTSGNSAQDMPNKHEDILSADSVVKAIVEEDSDPDVTADDPGSSPSSQNQITLSVDVGLLQTVTTAVEPLISTASKKAAPEVSNEPEENGSTNSLLNAILEEVSNEPDENGSTNSLLNAILEEDPIYDYDYDYALR